jgi:hypothetical protein
LSTFTVTALAFAAMASAGLLGLAMRPNARHAAEGSRDAVRFMQGTVASIAALVLGLLVASATDHYRSQTQEVHQLATKVFTLDRMLSQYGPEATEARIALRISVDFVVQQMWAGRGHVITLPPRPTPLDAVAALSPETPLQKFIQDKAFDHMLQMASARATMTTSEVDSAVQMPMVIALVAWFMCLFFAMGLFADLTALSGLATAVGSAAVASAILLVLSLDRPFEGMLAISDRPLRHALEALPGS